MKNSVLSIMLNEAIKSNDIVSLQTLIDKCKKSFNVLPKIVVNEISTNGLNYVDKYILSYDDLNNILNSIKSYKSKADTNLPKIKRLVNTLTDAEEEINNELYENERLFVKVKYYCEFGIEFAKLMNGIKTNKDAVAFIHSLNNMIRSNQTDKNIEINIYQYQSMKKDSRYMEFINESTKAMKKTKLTMSITDTSLIFRLKK